MEYFHLFSFFVFFTRTYFHTLTDKRDDVSFSCVAEHDEPYLSRRLNVSTKRGKKEKTKREPALNQTRAALDSTVICFVSVSFTFVWRLLLWWRPTLFRPARLFTVSMRLKQKHKNKIDVCSASVGKCFFVFL